jgi:tRNA 2-selenouridine synthase SelU
MTPNPPAPVSDFLSNFNDQLVAAARILGRSKHRQAIFEFVYYGPKQTKTVEEIRIKTGLSQTHVLKEGGKMAGLLLEKVSGGYKKRKDFATRYKTILAMAQDKKKMERVPTKTAPRIIIKGTKVIVPFPASARNARFVTVDDIGSFSKIGTQVRKDVKTIRERTVKEAFAKIIGEKGDFKDWGGEKSDLYSTKVQVGGKRVAAAIAFKGRATTGKLVPGKMGKNGDQINRLFDEPAELFLVVYGGQIDSSIIAQMRAFAMGKAIGGQKVMYGLIDGTDLGRLAAAYPAYF